MKNTKYKEKSDNFKKMIGQKFGSLTFTKLEDILSAYNKLSRVFYFECICGNKKQYNSSRVSCVFNGDTVSCGCVKKDKWRKSYYAWKTNFQKERQ